MKHVKQIMESKNGIQSNGFTVNGNYKNIPTVNSITVTDKISAFLEEENITPEGVALTLAEKLDDKKSLEYYLILARENQSSLLLEALSITLDADKRGKIRITKPIYFMGVLRRKGIRTKFKES